MTFCRATGRAALAPRRCRSGRCECGSCFNVSSTVGARPSNPLRMSVCPVANHSRTPAGTGIIAAKCFDHARQRGCVHVRANDNSLAVNQHDLHPAHRVRRRGWSSRLPICDSHRQELQHLCPAVHGASRLPPPGEQQIGVDAVALRHLRHGRAGREAIKRSAASHHSTRSGAGAPSVSWLDLPDPASSIAPTIVDGHYPRAALGALSPRSAFRPGGLRRRLTIAGRSAFDHSRSCPWRGADWWDDHDDFRTWAVLI